MNMIGQTLGHYHILEQLGEGGMATVYKAYDTHLERDVAIKVIRLDQFTPASLQSVLARFEREAKSLARLTHPNIVHINDYGEQDNVPYLVMDYLPGGTLKGRLGQPMKWQDASRLLLPIAQALGYAHEQNLIHRDVKPSNILMTKKGQPMLTDFGIAKILDTGGQTLTATGVGIGTPEYMAPEQWTGKTTPQSDIYSLGVVLYEMLTGRPPYTADTPAAILIKQATEALPRPKQYIPDLPEAVEKVLIKAMAKEPADRYETMDDFARALEGLLADAMKEEQALPTMAAVTAAKTLASAEGAKPVDLPTMTVEGQKEAELKTVLAPLPTGTGKPPPQVPVEKPTGKSPQRWWLWAVAGVVILAALGLAFLLLNPFGKGASTTNLKATIAPTLAVAINPATPTRVQATTAPAFSPEKCSTPEVFCVGLVTDMGTVNDKGFNQAAWEGILLAKEQGLVQVAQFIETQDTKDYEKNIAVFADGGYDMIVTAGWPMNQVTREAALMYPDVLFIGLDQTLDPDQSWPANFTGLSFPEDQAGFLVGALASRMSQSGYIAAVCGTDVVPAVLRFGDGYRAGAAFADRQTGRNTLVDVVYHPNDDKAFTDPEWGAVTAKALMDKGADVIFGCGGVTGNGAEVAAAQAGRYAIGVDVDQYYTLPEAAPRLLTSAMKDITPGVLDQIRAARNGTFTGGYLLGGAAYAPYHDLDQQVPEEVKKWMEEVSNGLRTGAIHTDLASANTCKGDPLGCLTIKPGEPIHIAYMLVVGGPNQTLGIDSRNGVEIAIDDLGGRILGHDILLDGQDSGCSTDGGKAAASKLAADPKIVGVIGPSCSTEVRGGMPILTKAGLVAISPSSTSPELTEPGNKNHFPGYLRTAHNDNVQGAKAAEYAYNVLGIRTAATVQDGSVYAMDLQQVFADNFIKLGGSISAQVAVSPDQTDMSMVLAKIAQGKPDLIYLPIFLPAGPSFVMQARTTPGLENVKLMGADGLFSPDVPKTAGAAVNGFMVSSPQVTGSTYEAFIKKYQARYGTPPVSIFHAHAYDAFMLLKAAIERSALVDADGTLHIGRQALRDALYGMQNYHGLTGLLSCTPNGDCANPTIGIYEYQNDTYPPILIYPR